MSGFMDFLWQGNPPASVTTSSTSASALPPWMESYAVGILNKANSIGAEGYQPYGSPRVADFSPDQQQAFDEARASAGAWAPMVGDAAQSLQQGSQPFNEQSLTPFMNPYTKNVVDQIAQLGNENFNEKIMPGVMDTFTGSGQFGSTRNQDFAARAMRDNDRNILNAQGQALNTGYQQAMTNYGDQQNRLIGAGTAMGGLASQTQAMTGRDVATLSATGGLQQALGQQNLDTAYQDFQRQRDFPKTTVDWLNSTLRGIPNAGGTTVNTATAPYQGVTNPSPLQVLSVLYGTGKDSGWFKRGGHVKRRAY